MYIMRGIPVPKILPKDFYVKKEDIIILLNTSSTAIAKHSKIILNILYSILSIECLGLLVHT